MAESPRAASSGNPTPLAGQHALITGGGSGIGLACAAALAADGAVVTLTGRTQERLDAGAAALRRDLPSAQIRLVVADVADEAAVEGAVAVAAEGAASGGLDLAVLSAGTGSMAPVVAHPLEQWQAVLDTNLTGAFLCIKHAASSMAASGGGAIVGISSIAGALTHRHMAAYCVSKAGLEMLLKTAADELGRAGVRVNGVRPGVVETDLAAPLTGDDSVRQDYLDQMPVSRVGQPGDIASGVRYLCGPESSWVTGQIVAIDGGHTLRRGPDLDVWARALYGDGVVDHGTP